MGWLSKVVDKGREIYHKINNYFREREEQRRERIRREYYEYERRKYAEVDSLYRYRNSQFSNIDSEYNHRMNEIRQQEIAQRKEINRDIYINISNMLDEQIEDKNTIIQEINSLLEDIKAIRNSQQNTLIRQKSMLKLRDDIYETRLKLNAYIYYLNQYRKRRLDYLYNKTGEIAEMFEFTLPEGSLYDGKLISIKKSELEKEGKLSINQSMDTSYICLDMDCIHGFDDEADIPVLATKKKGSYIFEVSCAKGMFKSMAIYQPRVGIEATVKKYEPGFLLLEYYGLELRLNKRNLFNPRRMPPRGAKIRVYPLRYRSDLAEVPLVTERFEESLNVCNFGNIPLAIPLDKMSEFKEFITSNHLHHEESEWRIAPFDEESIWENMRMKLQLGNKHILDIELVEAPNKGSYLRYNGVLSSENLLRVEDIFIDLDITLKTYIEKKVLLDNKIQENMDDFSLFIMNEFNAQKAIKDSVEGVSYYNKWSEITGRLIEYLSKGKPLLCDIIDVEQQKRDALTGLCTYRANIQNNEEIMDIIERHYNKGVKTEYFIVVDETRRYTVEFSPDATYLRIYGDFEIEYMSACEYVLKVYPRLLPYPEVMQKNALNVFREGRMANAKLKPFLLDGSKIIYTDTNQRVISFFNPAIENNLSQKDAVIKAVGEENLFMIQGPPGTGKTTVIKEIIQQHLFNYPKDKILIVSQANVAVDNVLRGLRYNSKTIVTEQDIIRCGNEESVGDDIKAVLFENKKKEYIQSIKEASFSNEEKDGDRKRWIEIVDDPAGETLIGECILKNHQLIGATCVGLEKRRLGLNEMIFDLVIIDEAGKTLPGEILIPINRAKKVILIGDHKQLPPVINPALYSNDTFDVSDIIEDNEKDDFLNESFFKRLYESCPETNKVMLNTQFRMPSIIGSMISELFYTEDALHNGYNTVHKEPIIYNKNLNIIDMSNVIEYREKKDEKSGPYNIKECEVVVNLLEHIRNKGYLERVVVITPYKNQKRYLIRAIREANIQQVDINTIDAFQGDEAEIVIYCTTRSKQKTDYFSYDSRLNVALSRAKNELIIIGSMKYFYSYGEGSNLYKIAEYITQKGNIIKCHEQKELIKCRKLINAEEKLEADRRIVSIEDIRVSSAFIDTPPKRHKIDNFKQEYLQNGAVEKCIQVDSNMRMVNGYAKYLAARELNIKEVEIQIVNK